MKKIRHAFSGLAAILLLCSKAAMMTAWAVNYNYVTITVDAVDDSGSLQYAIDSDAPEAFSDKSSFQVVPGSTHTIYVKDLSGRFIPSRRHRRRTKCRSRNRNCPDRQEPEP